MTSADIAEWRALVTRARPSVRLVRALTPVQSFGTYSEPVAIRCDDGEIYVVKGPQVRRALVADHVVGHLAPLVGAPIPPVVLVDLPGDLVAISTRLRDAKFEPGGGHGSWRVPDCSDRRVVEQEHEPGNPERFASLAVLYGWAFAGDHQLLYENQPPRLVYSVDHGHFFAGGPNWTVDTLMAAPPAEPDPWFGMQAATTLPLRAAIARLQHVTKLDIAEAVAAPHSSWPITLDERAALAQYLALRRDQLLARLKAV
jgi:hypothetical protein